MLIKYYNIKDWSLKIFLDSNCVVLLLFSLTNDSTFSLWSYVRFTARYLRQFSQLQANSFAIGEKVSSSVLVNDVE